MTKPLGHVLDGAIRARLSVRPASKAELEACIRQHYLGRWPGVVTARLALCEYEDVVGALVFALPPRETAKRYGCATWELARLWVDDSMPANTETFFVSRCVRWVKRNRPDVGALVSYADPSVGHSGVVYRAGNWTSDGRTDDERKTPRFDYRDARTGKMYSRRAHVPADAVLERVPRVSKHRFVMRLK